MITRDLTHEEVATAKSKAEAKERLTVFLVNAFAVALMLMVAAGLVLILLGR